MVFNSVSKLKKGGGSAFSEVRSRHTCAAIDDGQKVYGSIKDDDAPVEPFGTISLNFVAKLRQEVNWLNIGYIRSNIVYSY